MAVVGGLLFTAAPAAANVEDGSVEIEDNSQFTHNNGVRYGKGTKKSPHVIEGWDLGRLEIHDTNRYVVIRNNIISNLTLNWIGNRVKVVRNRIGDLRVNENVERTGAATSGVIKNNRFGTIGQLRHWDGLFANNVVGTPPTDDGFEFDFGQGSNRIANLDGFNGARYRDNTFYGYVEMRLHGHHHSSGFGKNSHYHGAGNQHNKMGLTHMKRFHRALFKENTIYATGPYGLIYTDSDHSANDRTAASETNEALNDPHEHTTKVAFLRNNLIGSGIMVDIFNADDEQKHLRTQTGHFTIKGNTIKLREYREAVDGWSEPPVGIEVHQARDLHLNISNNRITGPAPEAHRATTDQIGGHVASGIELLDMEKAFIHISNNFVSNRIAGIYARRFHRVQWWINGLRTEGVESEVDYDDSGAQPKGNKHEH
ncbi:MAG: hypothetical protein ACRDKT_14390 [Actinomycetota bacterium]